MTLHEHRFTDSGLVLWQCQSDCDNCLCQGKNLVCVHTDCRQSQQPLLRLLADFQSHGADADMSLCPLAGEVGHRPYLNLGFCYPEGLLYAP